MREEQSTSRSRKAVYTLGYSACPLSIHTVLTTAVAVARTLVVVHAAAKQATSRLSSSAQWLCCPPRLELWRRSSGICARGRVRPRARRVEFTTRNTPFVRFTARQVATFPRRPMVGSTSIPPAQNRRPALRCLRRLRYAAHAFRLEGPRRSPIRNQHQAFSSCGETPLRVPTLSALLTERALSPERALLPERAPTWPAQLAAHTSPDPHC